MPHRRHPSRTARRQVAVVAPRKPQQDCGAPCDRAGVRVHARASRVDRCDMDLCTSADTRVRPKWCPRRRH